MPEAESPPGEQPVAPELDRRIREFELQSQFPTRTVEELDAVVREFAERVARLEHELRDLRAQLESLTAGVDDLDLATDPV